MARTKASCMNDDIAEIKESLKAIPEIQLNLVKIDTNLTNHLEHHKQDNSQFQWRMGILVGVVTFVVSLLIRYIIKI